MRETGDGGQEEGAVRGVRRGAGAVLQQRGAPESPEAEAHGGRCWGWPESPACTRSVFVLICLFIFLPNPYTFAVLLRIQTHPKKRSAVNNLS